MHPPLAPNTSPLLNALALLLAVALDAAGYVALWRYYTRGPGGDELREGRGAIARFAALAPLMGAPFAGAVTLTAFHVANVRPLRVGPMIALGGALFFLVMVALVRGSSAAEIRGFQKRR